MRLNFFTSLSINYDPNATIKFNLDIDGNGSTILRLLDHCQATLPSECISYLITCLTDLAFREGNDRTWNYAPFSGNACSCRSGMG